VNLLVALNALIESGLPFSLLVILYLRRRQRLRPCNLARQQDVLLLPLAALIMFSLVHLEPRFFGGFVTVAGLELLAAVHIPQERASPLAAVIVAPCLLVLAIQLSLAMAREIFLMPQQEEWAARNELVASRLRAVGVHADDRIALVGDGFTAYWARLARARIVAEVTARHAHDFWAADAAVQQQVLREFQKIGAKVVVADRMPTFTSEDWEKIDGTTFGLRALGAQKTSQSRTSTPRRFSSCLIPRIVYAP